jgi:hypothetical protein
MKLLSTLLFLFLSLFSQTVHAGKTGAEVCTLPLLSANNCVSFTIGPDTGCSWMCNYCAQQLGTNNYYFEDGVCQYQTGGCVGNPQTGVKYTCCSASVVKEAKPDMEPQVEHKNKNKKKKDKKAKTCPLE